MVDYLDSEKSGAGGFEGMGADWVAVRNAARQRTLRPGDKGIGSVAADWVQFVEYLCLGLRQKLIREVTPVYPFLSRSYTRHPERTT